MKAKIFVGPAATGKTRVANLISEFVGKEKTATICGAQAIMKSRFVFSKIPEDTQLLIIDDLPYNFDFERFFPVEDNTYTGGDLTFSIRIERRGKQAKIIQVPFIIFTTNILNKKWLEFGASFHARFDVIQFPLSETA